MSQINTSGINTNYPVPGVNNNSQGFRNNFTLIVQNLDTAGNEITDLQTSVLLKNPLGNTPIDNDMGNVLISNASTLGFRSTTYNLGNDLAGSVTINLALADVHYGTLGSNVALKFGNWAPTGTLSKVTLDLSTSNAAANYSIAFPGEVIVASDNYGTPLLNNYSKVGNVATLTFPYDCTELVLECYSTDCGNTIYISPVNRPYNSVQIQTRKPPSTGEYGDVNGTVCVDPSVTQLNVTSSVGVGDFLVTSNTATLYTGMPVVFSGTSFESNIIVGTTYYVGNIANSTHFTVSANANVSGNVDLSGSSGNVKLNPVSYMYIATAGFSGNVDNRNILAITSPNVITISNSSNVAVNNPIMFTGNATGNTGNVMLDTVYYIRSVSVSGSNANITISRNRFNGLAGAEVNTLVTVSAGNVDVDGTVINGPDIFKRVPLQPF